MICQDCECRAYHHKYTLDGWACVSCERYCPTFDGEGCECVQPA